MWHPLTSPRAHTQVLLSPPPAHISIRWDYLARRDTLNPGRQAPSQARSRRATRTTTTHHHHHPSGRPTPPWPSLHLPWSSKYPFQSKYRCPCPCQSLRQWPSRPTPRSRPRRPGPHQAPPTRSYSPRPQAPTRCSSKPKPSKPSRWCPLHGSLTLSRHHPQHLVPPLPRTPMTSGNSSPCFRCRSRASSRASPHPSIYILL